MISIIIPTLWNYKPFCNFLQYVAELSVVGEIIIIDNNNKEAPAHDVLGHKKVRHCIMEKNMFVNPSWNIGVELSSHDILCFLSDDVAVDLRVFFEADRFVSKDIGILSFGTNLDLINLHKKEYGKIEKISNLVISGDITIEEGSLGIGSCFFIHKENWIRIPDEFKLYCGDEWQFDMQIQLGRKNYCGRNCFYYSPWHVSSESQDLLEYKKSEQFKKYENSEYLKFSKKQKLKEIREI